MKSISKICIAIFFVSFLCFSVAIKYTEADKITENVVNDIAKDNSENKEDNKKTVYLTFDDGPSKNTVEVLNILKNHDIKATFFVIAANINDDYAEQIKKMEEDGHSIGIHTYTHNYNDIYCSKDAYIKDFDKAYERLSQILDNPPKIYRFPGGSCNCYIGCKKKDIIEELSKRGFNYYDWNVSAEDSVGRPSANSIKKNVLDDFQNFDKPIILLHDSSINKNTVKVLDDIIDDIEKKGYEFETIKE